MPFNRQETKVKARRNEDMRTQKADLLLMNVDFLDENWERVRGRDIVIRDGVIVVIVEIRKHGDSETVYEANETVDGGEMLYLPGFIDSHMHTGQQLLRGRVLDAMPMIWKRIMLPFESTLNEEKMRLSAELAALDMIRSGTCGFIDAGSYFMDKAAEEYETSGLRGALSVSTMDEEGLPASIAMTAEEAIEKTDILFERFHGKGNLKVFYSLRSLISCSEDLIERAAIRAREKGTTLQAHMNEYPGEITPFLSRFQKRPYEFLDAKGILGPWFLGAHSLLLSEEEKDLMCDRQVRICHCPFSNCGKAVPETPSLLRRQIPVGIGTDGAAHGGLSLWNEMRIFRSVMNVTCGVPLAEPAIMPAKTILDMVTKGGAACLGEETGTIAVGKRADLIGIDLDAPHLWIHGVISNTLVESVSAEDVKNVIVGGRMLMKNREILTLDEEKIRREAQAFTKGV